MRRLLAVVAAAAASALLLSGCASGAGAPSSSDASASSTAGPASALTGELTVYAAASLGTAFDEIATAFAQEYPGVDVRPVVYDGSSTLATQIVEGASADVFASADEKNMTKVADAGLVAGSAELFASNTLVIAVPTGNPAGIGGLADLARPGVSVVLCAAEVPCGAASQTLLSAQNVVVTPVSSEQNVKAVLTKVAADEADAGLVYATDVIGDADVDSIVPEGADEVVNRYPVAALSGAANPEAAAAFTAFVTGPSGRGILAELGFGAP
ncbi:molybdate ABC transporter substrate-binding protein [Microbacterium sp. 1P10UB]|uniref:molybdate ABC transporter substrate-binding protein n=1 Tax=unclassified Microbacterium TaxID=2609290 RepID=UPI0039A32CE9